MADVKPPRGWIPPTPPPLTSSSASHGYFKVYMIVGDDDEQMHPVLVEKPQETMTIQHLVAIPGKKFRCRIDLDKAPADGIKYGARVYIDKGGLNCRHVFDAERGARVLESSDNGEYQEFDDANHFFWFGPGETSYTVNGFYRSDDEEYQFHFGTLPKGEEMPQDVGVVSQRRNQLGVIRFQFARVKEMVPNTLRARVFMAPPKQAADYSNGLLFQKGMHSSVRPGKRIKTGKRRDHVAVLEENIVYESVVHFNDMFGYKSAFSSKPNDAVDIYAEPSCLRGIPLCEFTQNTRSLFLKTFLKWLQQKRYDEKEKAHFASSDEENTELPPMHEAIGVEDLIHFINKSLSPAASYLVCTGDASKLEEFGEKLVQRRKGRGDYAYFARKEEALIAFFANAPNMYELSQNGLDAQQRQLWSVKINNTFEISDSDSE